MTNPTTPAQMREAAARECDRLGAEFAAEGAPIAKRMMDLASDRIRALPVAEPGRPAVGLLRGAMDAVAITKVAKTISSTITSFDLAWEHQSDQHRSMCMDAAARILSQIDAVPAAQVRAAALEEAAKLPPYDCDGDPAGSFDHHVFVKRDAILALIEKEPKGSA